MIATQRTGYGIPYAVACRALGVSQAWFYKWRGGDVSASRMRRRALARLVRCVFAAHRGTYGSPRITAELRALGWRVSKNTVAALMAEQHLVARPRRRRRALTKRSACARKAPDLLKRDFAPPPAPNVRWVGDLTDIPNDEGALYLAAVTDLHSRRVVGFALGEHHDARLAKAALCMAIAVRGGDVAGVVFHSDQGGEYTGDLFAQACHRAGVRRSMGRTGSALDNACAESLFSTLEFELLARSRFATRAQARRAVADWIDDYNRNRRHSTNHMLSPVAFELAAADGGGASAAGPPTRAKGSTGGGGAAAESQKEGGAVAGRGAPRMLRGRPSSLKGASHRAARDGPEGPPLTLETSAAPGGSGRGRRWPAPAGRAAPRPRSRKRQDHPV
jgi:putative transposase